MQWGCLVAQISIATKPNLAYLQLEITHQNAWLKFDKGDAFHSFISVEMPGLPYALFTVDTHMAIAELK